MSPGTLRKDAIVEYINSQNPAVSRRSIENIVGVYIEEAQKEQVNYDIAIAQMCEGTDYLSNRIIFTTHNYGDLRPIDNREASFPSMSTGIRAHIQQLKGYASRNEPVGQIVDRRRFDSIGRNRGLCGTLDELFPFWVSNDSNKYRNDINTILNHMYIYSYIN